MVTEYGLDMLTEYGVSIKTEKYAVIEGKEYRGTPHRKAYANSIEGRKALLQEVEEPFLTAVLAVWGDTPTVEDITEGN